MEYIEPWKTQIARHQIEDFDGDRLLTELFSSGVYVNRFDVESDICEPDKAPYLCELKERVIRPKGLEYIRHCWDPDVTDDRMSSLTWAVYGRENTGVIPHSHPGSLLTSALYVVGSPGNLQLMDPRHNAERGYPKRVRDATFPTHEIVPETGVFFLFPSYVPHFVMPAPGNFRVALITDYSFS